MWPTFVYERAVPAGGDNDESKGRQLTVELFDDSSYFKPKHVSFPKTFASAFGAFIVKVWEDVACLITAYVTSLTDNRRGSKWVSVVFTGRVVQMWHLRGGQLGRLGVIRGCRGNNEHRNTKDQLFLTRFIFPSEIIHLYKATTTKSANKLTLHGIPTPKMERLQWYCCVRIWRITQRRNIRQLLWWVPEFVCLVMTQLLQCGKR